MLNELELTAAPKADPKQAKPVKLAKALADFSQDNLEVAKAIDGNAERPGQRLGRLAGHRGRPLGDVRDRASRSAAPGGTVLTFKMHHKFADVWTLGRFRLSATRGAKPIGLSLPEDFRAVLAVAPEVRTEAQKKALLAPTSA